MNSLDAFEARFGFARSAVTIANWRERPFNRWSFQNVREVVPSASVARGREEEPLPDLGTLGAQSMSLDGVRRNVLSFLEESETDQFLVLKDGRPVAGWKAAWTQTAKPHLVFSISKSLTALVAGALEGLGVLDLEAPLRSILPEVQGSAYADATLRHLLDMQVSLDFNESYLDTTGGFARYRRATLWNPADGGQPEFLRDFLLTLREGEDEHGGAFRYRSPNSDLLGLVVERAGGKRFADLMAELLWTPLDAKGVADVTVDGQGSPRTAGGISVTAQDLARVGEMMRQGGAAGGRQVLAESFVRDTLQGGSPEAWSKGDFAWLFATGRYRNKWYATGDASGSFAAIGIHGQWLYVDPARAVTVVKMSSQALPTDETLDLRTVSFFNQLAAMV